MADGLNRVMLIGNLGADPELRFTQGGQGVLNMRLATTETYLDKNRQRMERTDWHNVVVWGKRGEALAKILVKGSSVFVEGSLRTSSYDNREGVKVYKTEIIANNILITNGRNRGEAPAEREVVYDDAPADHASSAAVPAAAPAPAARQTPAQGARPAANRSGARPAPARGRAPTDDDIPF
jgi:single-strand DNA-binding protein